MMRLYRLLLRLFPASFRAEYEEEMCAVFVARRREENALALWIGTIFDVAGNAVRVHADLLRQDLGWTLRTLRRSPGFTFTAIGVAALGIGATTAAYTLLDHVFLRPLPYPQPKRLVMLYQTQISRGYPRIVVSWPNLSDWRSMSRSFESVGALSSSSMNLSGQGEPRRLEGVRITAEVLGTLKVTPAIGRPITADDERNDSPGVVLLSAALSASLFADPAQALGRVVHLDEVPYTVIGVMPAGFAFPSQTTQFWIPLPPHLRDSDRSDVYLTALARLRPGVSIRQAQADLDVIAKRLERAYPKDNPGMGAAVDSMRDVVSPRSRVLVIAVFGAALCVLLIACTNLANLLFARALTRRREMAVRLALGAGRERLLRQLITENFILAAAGGALGLLLAAAVTPSLAHLAPDILPVRGALHTDVRVFVFVAALTLVTSFVFGAGPSLRASRGMDLDAMRARTAGAGRSGKLRQALVVAEIAGTVTLLVASGLLIKALWRIQTADPGFRADGVYTLRTWLPMPKYAAAATRREFYSRVLTGARALPGVASAAYTSFLPMTFGGGIFPAMLPGKSDDPAAGVSSSVRYVTPDYFATLGIPFRRGRDFSSRDTFTAPLATIISESLARRLWPGQDPLGRRVNIAFADRTVIGVVGDVSVRGFESPSEPQVYMPSDQMPDNFLLYFAPKDLVVHSSIGATAILPGLRRVVQNVAPDQAVSDVQSLDQIVSAQTASRRAQLLALGAFAGIAFVLAAVGIYGLLSFAVSTRTQEVGVRLALGASRSNVLGMFLRQGALLGFAGVALAIPLAYAAARGMTSLLFGVQPDDPLIYAAAAALALTMTMAGSLRPAVRAAGVDPAITIRVE